MDQKTLRLPTASCLFCGWCKTFFGTILLFGMALAVAGCGGGTGAVSPPPPSGNPTPSITSLSPPGVTFGGGDLTLTIKGGDFVAASVVNFGGSAAVTTFVSNTQLTATIPAASTASPGTIAVTVTNPAPGGGTSNSMNFTVNTGLYPWITSLSPTSVLAGGSDLTLTVNGSNFTSSATVTWNLGPGPAAASTTFVNAQQLTATIPSGLIIAAGYVGIAVETPFLSGVCSQPCYKSNTVQFVVNNPAPQISSISPDNAIAGAAPLTLTVSGTNFISGATVLLNGHPRPVDSFTPTQMVTTLSVADLAAAGTISVAVANPAPAVAPSNSATFTITPFTANPMPSLVSASDVSVPQGWPGFPLTVYGTGFVGASVLEWNGSVRQTTVVSATELQGAIPASDLAVTGTAQVAVSNTSPGGGTSNSLPIQIQAVAAGAIGVIDRANVGTDLTEPNGASTFAALSADGRYVVFASSATNLAPNTPDTTNLFLRDTCNGAPNGCVPSVTLEPGTATVDPLSKPAISSNGRYLGFSSGTDYSLASSCRDLSPPDCYPDGGTVFVLADTCLGAPAGCVPSVPFSYPPGGTRWVGEVSLSADGRFAVYLIHDFVGCGWWNECNGEGIVFLTDTCTGVSSGCAPSSQNLPFSNIMPASEVERPSISPDGRFVAYNYTNGDIELYDTCQGAPTGCSASSTMVSIGYDGSPADRYSYGATISTGGRYVTFLSSAGNLVSGISDTSVIRLYLRDMCIGAPPGCVPATTLIAVVGDVPPGSYYADGDPSISADGRFIAFASAASDLVPGDTNGATDVFVYDTCIGAPSGCTPSTVRVSVAWDGTQGNADSTKPVISADGRFVVFISAAKLAPGTPNSLGGGVYLARH